jgi:small-conductance mechanosensitive channel
MPLLKKVLVFVARVTSICHKSEQTDMTTVSATAICIVVSLALAVLDSQKCLAYWVVIVGTWYYMTHRDLLSRLLTHVWQHARRTTYAIINNKVTNTSTNRQPVK